MVKIVKLEEATDKVHKWVAHFDDGRQTAFGAYGMDDYTITKDEDQRIRYRIRHHKDLKTKDPHKPGYLSWFILWGDSTSIKENVEAFNKRFS